MKDFILIQTPAPEGGRALVEWITADNITHATYQAQRRVKQWDSAVQICTWRRTVQKKGVPS